MTDLEPVPFALPDIGQREIDAVSDVLRSRWLTTGKQCREFERTFASTVGASYAVALNSCTAALHLSLEALGVRPGDLVFLSPYTFAASGEVVRYLGATPVFVDIDPVTLNISPVRLQEAVEASLRSGIGTPRAVIPVHIAGVPCAMDEIWDIARTFDLAVVEDAAHAFPSSYRGRPVGAVPPDIRGTVCFSFYPTKTITTGEGGMLTTEDKTLADRARSMSLHGLSHQAWTRYSGGSWSYDIAAPGYKYNLTDIAAALGLVQLSRADEMTKRRADIAGAYNAAFTRIDALECPTVPVDVETSWHLYVLRLNLQVSPFDRKTFIERLNALGVGTSVHFIPLHLHSYYITEYGHNPEDFPEATTQFMRVVSLPIYSAMTDADVERVIRAVQDLVGDRNTLRRAG
jgi:perosamine synthetase